MMKKRSEHGQSLLEALIAVSLLTIIIGAVVTAVTVSTKNSTFSRNKSLANSFVGEGMEAVRNIRDRSWDTFYEARNNTWGLSNISDSWEFSSTSDSPAAGFTRTVTLTEISDTEVRVEVKVEWYGSSSDQFKSESTTILTKWAE